jgi:hypothetical protein
VAGKKNKIYEQNKERNRTVKKFIFVIILLFGCTPVPEVDKNTNSSVIKKQKQEKHSIVVFQPGPGGGACWFNKKPIVWNDPIIPSFSYQNGKYTVYLAHGNIRYVNFYGEDWSKALEYLDIKRWWCVKE